MATRKRQATYTQPEKEKPKPVEEKFRYNKVSALNEEQEYLIQQLYRNDVLVVTGIAGSGKTHCCCGVAADLLKREKIEQLIISRPAVAAEKMGFLKGGMKDKMGPYSAPILNELDKFINVKQYLKNEQILVLPVAFMRGWNFENACVLIDESQNLRYSLIKLIITRLCKDSKMIFMGDCKQSDLDSNHFEDFAKFIDKVDILAEDPANRVAVVELLESVRHPLVEKFLSVM